MILKYLITDPSFYGHDGEMFRRKLEQVLELHRPQFALYRDKNFQAYDTLARLFVTTCQRYDTKPLLHNNAPLAKALNAYGVHYSSDRLCSIGNGDRGLFRVLSCHTPSELQAAQKLGLDAATYSPIFETPNKGTPVGLASLKHCLDTIDLPIIALGGITSADHVAMVEKAGAWAFASIRYFFPKESSYV